MLLNAFSRSLDVGTQGFRGGIQHPFPTYCDYLTTYKHPCILKDV